MKVKQICKICNNEFESKTKLSEHLCKDHNILPIEYYDLCFNTNSKCIICGKPSYIKNYFSKPGSACKEHLSIVNSSFSKWHWIAKGFSKEDAEKKISEIQKKNSKKGNGKYSLEYLIANGHSEDEAKEIVKDRLSKNPKRREYYNSDEEFKNALNKFAEKQREVYAKDVKGYHSVFSKNFFKYEGLSDEEKLKRIRTVSNTKDNPNYRNASRNTTLEFFMNKGLSELDAKKALHERQCTFSLKNALKSTVKKKEERDLT